MVRTPQRVLVQRQLRDQLVDDVGYGLRGELAEAGNLHPPKRAMAAHDIQDNARQRGALERERWAAMNERDGLLRNIEMLKSRKLEFQSQRAQLDSQVKTLRAAVTRLTDAVQFWRDMGVLIRSDIGTVDFLKDGVQRLAQRAGTEAPAPVFDRYDAETVRSLEQTLKDFARSIDEGRNILLAPQG